MDAESWSPPPSSEPERMPEKKVWGMSEAIGEVLRLEHEEVNPTGGVDSETNQFALIRSRIINGEWTPNQGVEEAVRLVESRQER